MKDLIGSQKSWTALAAALALASGTPALADDTEIFKGDANLASGVQPNVLFILDTSGSMSAQVRTNVPYDASVTYSGPCSSGRVYWRRDSGAPPGSSSSCTGQWFHEKALRCDTAVAQLATDGLTSLDYFSQYDHVHDDRWEYLRSSARNRMVECENDLGIHGETAEDKAVYPADGDAGPWSASEADQIIWGSGQAARRYIMYTGNYLNWYHGPGTTTKSRLQVMQDVTAELLDELSDINVGVMRFSRDGDGGMVVHAMEDIETGRDAAKAAVNAMRYGGNTPLSETLYEAAAYYRGDKVDFGRDSEGNGYVSMPSVASSRTGAGADGGDLYLSPIGSSNLSCQKNFIVLLTDGAPTYDTAADSKTANLQNPAFSKVTGRTSCDGSGSGRCLDDIAEYLFKTDMNGDPSDGVQNITTYTVGFTVDLKLLDETARRGGGDYYLADDTESLKTALGTILTEILEDNTTFSAPSVSVNTFNRTQNLDQLFVSVFKAGGRPLWAGNLKKYRLVGDDIVGFDGTTPVVDPDTGFFREDARSIWSERTDGAEVPVGGAANRIPAPALRNVYTYTGTSAELSAPGNHLSVNNPAITAELLQLGPDDPELAEVVNWARGQDTTDADGDGDTLEARLTMGDPLHAKPAPVVYGGSAASPNENDVVVYVATNEGFLHAIDGKTGAEIFVFMPAELLPNLTRNYENSPSQFKGYGLDGTVKTFMIDDNNDGIVDASAGDRVILFFGMRRGGSNYYAVDVTRRDAPRLLWTRGGGDLPRIGQTWSTPSLAKVHVDGASQNAHKAVMIVGGGYDSSQDNAGYSADSVGNAVYMLDALTGALLWTAGPDSTHDLVLPDMTNSIPSPIRVIDVNTDGFADRMYVGDMGGRVWRFDIYSGKARASLVTGGVLASLGAADLASPSTADNRRFYNAPDVSFVRREAGSYFNIAIGSGYRAHPLSSKTSERFYALRDYAPFRHLQAAEFLKLNNNKLTDADRRLADITGIPESGSVPTLPAGSLGWKMNLASGEKVLTESRTFEDKVFFTTYQPAAGGNSNSCVPSRGKNKLYIVQVEDGSPVKNLDGVGSDETLTVSDRFQELSQTGIAPEVTFVFHAVAGSGGGGSGKSGGDDDSDDGDDSGKTCPFSSAVRPKCLVGMEKCATDFCNSPIRTFWTQDDATDDE